MNPHRSLLRVPPPLVGEKEALRICRAALPRVGKVTLRRWRVSIEGLYMTYTESGRGYYVVKVLVRQLKVMNDQINRRH